jgi:acetyl esterase/lipase
MLGRAFLRLERAPDDSGLNGRLGQCLPRSGVVLGPVSARRLQARRHPRLADQRQLRATQGSPQTLLFVDENDVLRDEGEAYGRKLAPAGVTVTSVRYNGTIHDFMLLNPIANTPAVRRSGVRLSTQGLRGPMSASPLRATASAPNVPERLAPPEDARRACRSNPFPLKWYNHS